MHMIIPSSFKLHSNGLRQDAIKLHMLHTEFGAG